MVELLGKQHADALQNLHKGDQQNDRYPHHVSLPAVVAVADGDIAQTAAAEHACHRRIPEDRAERNRHADKQRCARLADEDLENNRAVGRAHALCRLNDALVDLVERRLDAMTRETTVAVAP